MSSPDAANLNPSALIYPPPTQILDDDLHTPTMVAIYVKRETDPDVVFTIPRALICARSKYFNKAFMGSYNEAAKKQIFINQDKLVQVRLFVKWLYTGQLYADPPKDYAEPPKEHTEPSKEHTKPSKEHAKPPKDITSNELDDFQKWKRSVKRNMELDEKIEDSPRKRQYFRGYEPSFTAINTYKKYGKNLRYNDNPVSWSWDELFDLYAFADEFDTRALRNQVVELIQLKALQTVPYHYAPPSTTSTASILSRIPASSKLFRLLVDMYARGVQRDHGRMPVNSTALSKLPPEFVAECFLVLKSREQTHEYSRYAGRAPVYRGLEAPEYEGRGALRDMDPCTYHEHPAQDYDEKLACSMRWTEIQKLFFPIGRKAPPAGPDMVPAPRPI